MTKNPAQSFKNLRPWALAAFSGMLLVLIFPRFDLEFLAWFAFVPLFIAIQDQPLARSVWLGFTTGMVFYFFGLHWVINTLTNYGNLPLWLGYPTLLLLAAYLSLYLGLFCYLLKRLGRDNSAYFLAFAPLIWTALEWARSTDAHLGFSWLGLGYSQYLTFPVIQGADITGIYGVSALIMLVNATLYLIIKQKLYQNEILPNNGLMVRATALTSTVLLLWLAYGYWSLSKYDSPGTKSLKIALAQGNIPQHQKWDSRFREKVFDTYSNLTLKASKAKPDLIVWPEAATPFYYQLDRIATPVLNQLARSAGSPILFGSPYQEKHNGQLIDYNSAFLVSAKGENRGRYDKIHLVPFGEFVPFQKLLFFVRKLVHTIGNFGRGQEATVFDLNGNKFGLSICYEIIFPDLARQPVKNGAQFLVNITNDAWFGESAASYQHMAMGALRAVENRVPIVRAANTGISGTIDPTGRMRQTTKLFVEELVITEITPSNNGVTTYARYGDLFSYLCIGMTGLLAFVTRQRK
jgi:apolipoprotein N-acyltransferase